MDDTLLQAFGFEEIAAGTWFYRKQSEVAPFDVATVVVAKMQDGTYEGHVPLEEDSVAAHGLREVPGVSLVFRSADVRDMIALAHSAFASISPAVHGEPAREGFATEDDTLFVDIPFGGVYGGYVLANPDDGDAHKEILGAHDLYGDVYLEWRDDFCARLAEASPRP